MGRNALNQATTADNNTSIGTDSGRFVTTASGSTFVGTNAAKGITGAKLTGDNNTAIGESAGLLLQGTGNHNTLLGFEVGDNITTGDSNQMFGINLSCSAATADNNIVIGSNITGAGPGTVRIGKASGEATLSLDGSDTSWAAASDSRLKKDVADSTVGLEFIKDLRPVTFKWNAKNAVANSLPQYNADSSDPVYGEGKAHHGFIAQEVKAVIDSHSDVVNGHNLWSEDPNGTQQVAPSALVPMLVKAIQELEARIATLEG